MAEHDDPRPAREPSPALPAPRIEQRAWRKVSLVWLVPVVALAVGLVMVGRAVLRSGPDIEIELRSAEGLEPGRTEVRYKEVVVGRVTDVELTEDRQRVVASVSLNRSVSQLAVADTRFWVVRPRIGAAGVSGLTTLFSGAYLAVDAGSSDQEQLRFVALETEPVPLRGEPGRGFVLSAADLGSLEVGSPVTYRRTRVGRVVGYTLDPARDSLDVRVFIESPYEPLVTAQSRFWNASGVDFAVDANGLQVNAQSIASLIAGGLAFASPPGAASAPPAREGQRFELFETEALALAPPDGEPVRIRLLFDRSVRGLSVGAPIDLLGLEVGTVRDIALPFDRDTRRFLVEVTAEVYPLRIGNRARRMLLAANAPTAAASAAEIAAAEASQPAPDTRLLRRLVETGLRAQLRTGNLLTGQLYVALDFIPNATPVQFDAEAEVPTLPTVPGTLSDLQQQLADIVGRIGKVPFDRIAAQLQSTLGGAEVATRSLAQTLDSARGAIEQLSPEAKAALADVRKTLEGAQSSLQTLDRNLTQPGAPLQRNANDALTELRRAALSLRVLADYLQQHPQALLRGKPGDPVLPAPALAPEPAAAAAPGPAPAPGPADAPAPAPANGGSR